MHVEVIPPEDIIVDTHGPVAPGHATWKQAQVTRGLDQANVHASLIPPDKVWRDLGLYSEVADTIRAHPCILIPYTVSNPMSKADKLLEQMRRNPAGDWSISDIQRLCEHLGWECLPPTGGGSHWKIAVPGSDTILTIPAKRPIKPIYIRKLMEFVRDK